METIKDKIFSFRYLYPFAIIVILLFFILGIFFLQLQIEFLVQLFILLIFVLAVLKRPKWGLYTTIFFSIVQFQAFEVTRNIQKMHPLLILIVLTSVSYSLHLTQKGKISTSFLYRDTKKPLTLVLLFWLYSSFTLLFSRDFEVSLLSFKTLSRSVFIFFLILLLIKSKKSLISLLKIIVISCTILLFLDLLNIFNLSYAPYIGDVYEKYFRYVPTAGYDPNEFSVILNCSLPLFFIFLVLSKSYTKRVLYFILISLCSLAIIMSLSRTGLFNMIFIYLLIFFTFYQKHKKFFFLVVILIVLLLTTFHTSENAFIRIKNLKEFDLAKNKNILLRIVSCQIGWKIFTDRFPFGSGIGNYRTLFNDYIDSLNNPYVTYLVSDAGYISNAGDNSYIIILSETGIVGICIFSAMMWFSFLNIKRVIKETKRIKSKMWYFAQGIKISYISLLLSFFTLSIFYSYQFWLLLGVIFALNNIIIKKEKKAANF